MPIQTMEETQHLNAAWFKQRWRSGSDAPLKGLCNPAGTETLRWPLAQDGIDPSVDALR